MLNKPQRRNSNERKITVIVNVNTACGMKLPIKSEKCMQLYLQQMCLISIGSPTKLSRFVLTPHRIYSMQKIICQWLPTVGPLLTLFSLTRIESWISTRARQSLSEMLQEIQHIISQHFFIPCPQQFFKHLSISSRVNVADGNTTVNISVNTGSFK